MTSSGGVLFARALQEKLVGAGSVGVALLMTKLPTEIPVREPKSVVSEGLKLAVMAYVPALDGTFEEPEYRRLLRVTGTELLIATACELPV